MPLFFNDLGTKDLRAVGLRTTESNPMESYTSNRVERGASDIARSAVELCVSVDGGIQARPVRVKEKRWTVGRLANGSEFLLVGNCKLHYRRREGNRNAPEHDDRQILML